MRCSDDRIQYTFSFTFFFFNDTATTEIYTLSLHDALPISEDLDDDSNERDPFSFHYYDLIISRRNIPIPTATKRDRKSTRLNSSHGYISYAVFCLKKKSTTRTHPPPSLYHLHGTSPSKRYS